MTLREQAGAVGMTSPFESCRPRYCVPSEERATSKLSVMTRLQQVSSDAEEVLDKSMNGQESLGLTRRFEPSHLPFTLPRRLVDRSKPFYDISVSKRCALLGPFSCALRACSDARDHNTTIFSSPKGEGFRPSPEETLIRNSGCSVWVQ